MYIYWLEEKKNANSPKSTTDKLIIESSRLTLHQITPDDASFIQQLVNTPGWLQFIGDRNVSDISSAKSFIQTWAIERYQKYGYGPYKVILKEQRKTIGVCGLFKRDYLEHPDLGFAFLPEYIGKGFAKESSLAVIEYARQLNQKLLYAITDIDNEASQQLIRVLGFSISPSIKREGAVVFELELKPS